MRDTPESKFSRSDTVVEGVIISIIFPLLGYFQIDWNYYWVLYLAYVMLIFLFALRVAATQAEEPRWELIQKTIRWSSFLLQLCLLAIIAGISIRLTQLVEWITSPLLIFAVLGTGFVLFVSLVDQILLNEYMNHWADIIRENTNEDVVGKQIRQMADVSEEIVNTQSSRDSGLSTQQTRKTILRGIGVLLLLAIITAPLWYLVGDILNSLVGVFAVILTLLLVRDLTRYLYLNYGPARGFEEFKTDLSTGYILLLIQIVIVTSLLGFTIR